MYSTDISLHPPATHDVRPEIREKRSSAVEKAVRALSGGIVRFWRTRMEHPGGIVQLVKKYEQSVSTLSDREIREKAQGLGMELRRHGMIEELVAQVFALVREASGRTLGMRHFDCQLVGGAGLLKGMVVEMETGEGKTLTATLPATAAALAGIPVHVISVNDYLTSRDAGTMGPVYRALGLSVGCVQHGMEYGERRSAYECNITYCTNKEIVFDYLRDRITLEECSDPLLLQAEYLYGRNERVRRIMLRGLHFAIVDEADSILIDEARTPLLISKMTGDKDETRFIEQAMALTDLLREKEDFTIDIQSQSIHLTSPGKERLTGLTESMGPLWTGRVRREEMARQALTAQYLFRRDEHYLVQDGKVQIVDEFTGRVMPDRSWERGLHQLIEMKEGCEVSGQRETQARISYQRFFRRYLHLSGMTGTAREVAGEVWSVYGMPVLRVPTNRPMVRKGCPDRIFLSRDEKWHAVVERVRQLHESGRPVLVGTRTVAASEHLSKLFHKEGLRHEVLNAKYEQEEADIIARAGEYGRITIATNMAGRGTDIKLAPGVADRKGLHVILTERHEAGRIDRQLAGRCGRQGDPGSFEAVLSLDDPLLRGGRSKAYKILSSWMIQNNLTLGTTFGKLAITAAQKKVERIHVNMRKELLKMDEQKGETLSFSGGAE